MTDFDIEMGLIELAISFALALLVWRLWPTKPDPVVGSELDRRWADVEHAYHKERSARMALLTPKATSIAETHLGPIGTRGAQPTRREKGKFATGNSPFNTGTSKQLERLHLAGAPHVSTVAMMDADCTQTERRVIHLREQGNSLALIAQRLGVTIAKVRRLEKSAVDKILAARKEQS
jgi:DNA-binding CsgD family transcriptional regulator